MILKMKGEQHEGMIPVNVKTNCSHNQADWLVGKEVR